MPEKISFPDIQFNEEGEQIILVNSSDEIIGQIGKLDAHLHGAQLHRAFSLFIINEHDQLLLQQRSPYKPLFGKFWSNTVCSHPAAILSEQNSEIGAKKAVHRKTLQELNINLSEVEINEMTLLKRIIYDAKYSDELSEKELDYVFVLCSEKDSIDTRLRCNEAEVMATKWVSIDEMDAMIADGVISPWCKKIYLNFFRELWSKKSFEKDTTIIFI